MAILRVRDEQGNVIPIPAVKGEKGDRGDSGVIVGSYVGDGSISSRYIDLGSPNVVAAVVSVSDMVSDHPNNALVTGRGIKYNGTSLMALIENGPYTDSTALALYYDSAIGKALFNENGVTYTYIAFVSEG